MAEFNYKNLRIGDEIKVVTAWGESETLEEISAHFFKTKIENIYFQPSESGEFGFLKIYAKDGDGISRRVHWIIQDGEIKSADVVVKISVLKAAPKSKPLDARRIARILVRQERMAEAA